MSLPERTVTVDAECRDAACQKFGECKVFRLEMTEEQVRHAVARGVSREGPGRIALDCCPRYGGSNPLCFILKTVNGKMVGGYQDLLDEMIAKTGREIEEAKEKHRLLMDKLYRRLNSLQKELDNADRQGQLAANGNAQ